MIDVGDTLFLGNANRVSGMLDPVSPDDGLNKRYFESILNLSGKHHYRGVAPYPSTPTIGSTWEEVNSFGNWIGDWFWNGTYWLSVSYYYETWNFFAITATATAKYPIDPAHNIFVVSLEQNFDVASNLTNAAFWSWTVQRLNSAKVATNIAPPVVNNSLTTTTTAKTITPVNVHVSVAATGAQTLGLTMIRNTTAGAATGTLKLKYQKARI